MIFLQKAFWGAGFHVICLSSPTQMNFITMASATCVPGNIVEDAQDLYRVMTMAWELGDDGINYASKNNPDEFTWGPPAFTTAPDGTFWIADTVDNRLLHYSTEGEFLDKISIGDFVLGAGDLEVTSNEIWVLDKASSVPKVAHFTLDGKFINSFDLPDGLRPRKMG